MNHKREMLEQLRASFSVIENFFESESGMAEQFVGWMTQVASALEGADMIQELEVWNQARYSVSFSLGDTSMAIQMSNMKSVLLGILDGLEVVQPSDELLPMEIVQDARGYIKNMARQANGCYRQGWHDACAVMLRRLIEVLIIDSFDAKGKLGDIRYYGVAPPTPVSDPPTESEVRRFRDEEFGRLEIALNDVRASVTGGSTLMKGSAGSNWDQITAKAADEAVRRALIAQRRAFGQVLDTRERALQGTVHVTAKELTSARQGIHRILAFLDDKFPTAGVGLPSPGKIVPLARLMNKYIAAGGTYWHVEPRASTALWKIKRIGDLGAHGRYIKVTWGDREILRQDLSTAIQQLVGTACDR